ncbi:MAG: serine O-acetyltransferase EpsC [Planctomycetota bacterium]
MATDFRKKEDRLAELHTRLVATYGQTSCGPLAGMNHLDHCPLPKYDEVIAAIRDLMEVLYPGYGRRQGLHGANIGHYVGDLLDRLHDRLTTQMGRALRHEQVIEGVIPPCDGGATAGPDAAGPGAADPGAVDPDAVDYEALGQAKALEFLAKLPELRQTLATDVQAAYDGDPACKSTDEVIFCYPGLEAVTVYRLANLLYRDGVPLLPRMMSEWAHSRTGIDIHPGATIGKYFFIDHGTGVVIGETCEIGDHVKLYQGVTLGALSFPTDESGALVRDQKRHPTIEDGVVIYANATVLGGRTTIGKGSTIGSSVWLTRSVAAGTTVVLEKPALRMKGEQPSEATDALEPETGYQI